MKKVIVCTLVLFAVLQPVSGQVDHMRAGIGTAILLNILPGFGVGSFAQGDRMGGGIQVITQLIGLACFGALFSGSEGMSDFGSAMAAGGVAWGLSIGSRWWGCYRARRYGKEHGGIHNSSKFSFGIMPTLEPCSDLGESCFGIRLELMYTIE